MTIRMQATSSAVAIYTGTDDLPFTDPYNHISRVKLHTSVPLIPFGRSPAVVATVTVPATYDSADGRLLRLVTLGAHGKASAPFAFAYAQNTATGVRYPLVGSVPVIKNSEHAAVFWALAVDNNYLYISESRVYPFLSESATFVVTVMVSDKLL